MSFLIAWWSRLSAWLFCLVFLLPPVSLWVLSVVTAEAARSEGGGRGAAVALFLLRLKCDFSKCSGTLERPGLAGAWDGRFPLPRQVGSSAGAGSAPGKW